MEEEYMTAIWENAYNQLHINNIFLKLTQKYEQVERDLKKTTAPQEKMKIKQEQQTINNNFKFYFKKSSTLLTYLENSLTKKNYRRDEIIKILYATNQFFYFYLSNQKDIFSQDLTKEIYTDFIHSNPPQGAITINPWYNNEQYLNHKHTSTTESCYQCQYPLTNTVLMANCFSTAAPHHINLNSAAYKEALLYELFPLFNEIRSEKETKAKKRKLEADPAEESPPSRSTTIGPQSPSPNRDPGWPPLPEGQRKQRPEPEIKRGPGRPRKQPQT